MALPVAALLLASCADEDSLDRMRDQARTAATDPAFDLADDTEPPAAPTVPPAPTLPVPPDTVVPDDPAVGYHYTDDITADQREIVRRGVLLTRMSVDEPPPMDVYVYVDPDAYLDEWLSFSTHMGPDEARGLLAVNSMAAHRDGRFAVFLNGRTIFDVYPSGKTAFHTSAHETAHVIQDHWIGDGSEPVDGVPGFGPFWLIEGHADVIAWAMATEHGELIRPWPEQRATIVASAVAHGEPLEAYAGDPFPQDDVDGRYSLWYLAAEWLEHRAGEDAWPDYWQRSAREGWPGVFADVFGLEVEDYYDEFTEWRANGFPALG